MPSYSNGGLAHARPLLPAHRPAWSERRRQSLVGLGLAAGLALLLSTPGAATAKPLFGFNEDWSGGPITASDPFRPTTQRLPVYWVAIEPAPGIWNWASTDAAYREMVAQGAPPVGLVLAAPCWAGGCQGGDATPVSDYPAWRRFVEAVVRRYPRLVALEVWNEPNYSGFYPRPDPVGYVDILRNAYQASKAARPGLPVLGGSLAPITTRERARGDGGFPRNPPGKYPYAPFLDQMYRLGAGRYMDGVAFHPYPNFAPYLRQRELGGGVRKGFARGVRLDVEKQISTVRRIQRRHGAPAPIWATETGACTTGPRERRTSAREQAVALREVYLALERLGAKAIVMHRLWDVRVPGTSPDNIENGCGLTDVSGRHKPAWNALRRLRASRPASAGRRVR